jgi:c-di-GMP-binding flagellar brake protein YcgR
MGNIDKRKFQRFPIPLPVAAKQTQSHDKSQQFEFITKNISSGGLFFKSDLPLLLDTELQIEIIIPEYGNDQLIGHRELLGTKGKIVRIEKKGIGIRFNTRLEDIENNLILLNSYLKSENFSKDDWERNIQKISDIYFDCPTFKQALC